MELGPVEYIMIGFPGNKFSGEIAPALAKLIENETVRILDLVFVMKDADGDTSIVEFDQLDELAPFGELEGETGALVNEEDIAYAAAGLEPNTSGLLIVWEDLWAAELALAVRRAEGVVLEGARIPHELVSLAFADADTVASDA
jgi:hypothetical protein